MDPKFSSLFKSLTGNEPFPWQEALFDRFKQDNIPSCCDLPTGLGKTSVVAIWLIALALHPEKKIPRRLAYVVNRRTVVDQTTVEVEKYRKNLSLAEETSPLGRLRTELEKLCALKIEPIPQRDGQKGFPCPLALSTLRGQLADNREWSADPCRPAVIVGTVDMIGSRLLFSGYGASFKTKPLFAGFLGQDVLIVHDEAHLEPAFQALLESIKNEQRDASDERKIQIMQLSATMQRQKEEPFTLTEEEKNPPAVITHSPTKPLDIVWQRMNAKKTIAFEKAKDVATRMGQLAKDRAKSHPGAAILIYVHTLEDHATICKALKDESVQILTGTMRGLERDRMVNPREETGCPIFARFLKPPSPDDTDSAWKVTPKAGTVYLVCTSAGEVGIDLSADHMVCDLTTFERIAQRLGRVNRFGKGDAEIDIVCEETPEPKKKDQPHEQARWKTLELLNELPESHGRKSASPLALMALRQQDDLKSKIESAYAPTPAILPATDILFDAWSLTSIRDKLPGRPKVEPYLHGITDYEPPQTQVAWREEVEVITEKLLPYYPPKKLQELLEDYPLKPHELLKDHSKRVLERLEELTELKAENRQCHIWLIDDGAISVHKLGDLISKSKKEKEIIDDCIVLLPPTLGGQSGGMLNGKSESADDVADDWLDEKGDKRRFRIRSSDPKPQRGLDMRSILTIDTDPEADEREDGEPKADRYWHWYERPDEADNEGSCFAIGIVLLKDHTNDVEKNMENFLAHLDLSDEIKQALRLAACAHDLGKNRKTWQNAIGNFTDEPWAKSGKYTKLSQDYRHEFGSLLDATQNAEFQKLPADMKDVVLHLIAAHHGRGRPHFSVEEAFDPEGSVKEAEAIALEVPRRFARLQQRYGRWGLAWLESLLRAADYAASAAPSATVKETP